MQVVSNNAIMRKDTSGMDELSCKFYLTKKKRLRNRQACCSFLASRLMVSYCMLFSCISIIFSHQFFSTVSVLAYCSYMLLSCLLFCSYTLLSVSIICYAICSCSKSFESYQKCSCLSSLVANLLENIKNSPISQSSHDSINLPLITHQKKKNLCDTRKRIKAVKAINK